MDKFMRYLGVIAILIGVLVLFLYYLGVFGTNSALVAAALLFIGGVAAHVLLGKKFAE